MAKPIGAIKIIQARRNILNKLDMIYPSGLCLKDIFQVNQLDPFYDWNLFGKDIAYLKDKGYVIFIDNELNPLQSAEQKIIRLTTTGKEIAEQTMIDEALEIL